ncbi:MAG: hypothetical protein P8L18_12890 [Verrucomicrobiota bacterium]|nr:hypothetical protein [Verrucomicrobiota bacterium]MDG1892199.1 hypothetical protein [Verrucomicrobiota bacterium]
MGWQSDHSFWFDVISLAHPLHWLHQRWGRPPSSPDQVSVRLEHTDLPLEFFVAVRASDLFFAINSMELLALPPMWRWDAHQINIRKKYPDDGLNKDGPHDHAGRKWQQWRSGRLTPSLVLRSPLGI